MVRKRPAKIPEGKCGDERVVVFVRIVSTAVSEEKHALSLCPDSLGVFGDASCRFCL
jgi:hypothetical protein